jgi:UDP-N-acetylmuramoyl-tripeptide--D-alanyl-D-alanine ligase
MTTLHDLHEAIHGVLRPAIGSDWAPRNVSLGPVATDSRKVSAGDVFWGLVGPHNDGSEFASEAFARGAGGAVVSSPVETPDDRWVLTVDDTQKALERWAAWHRQRFTGTAIAVTGSVGKTTTRQMIHTVLGSRLTGSASPKNYNNHVGLPLSMLEIKPADNYAVFELGASHVGEIAALAGLCAPKIGVITKIGDAHLASFGSQRTIAETKAELLASLPPDGHAVLGDDPWLRRMAQRCQAPITWVGHSPECDLAATEVCCGQGQLSFRVCDCEFSVPVWGRHHLTSALAAIGVARMLGFDLPQIASALKNFQSVPMRCQVIEIREATIINDAYNGSPTSMQAALELVRDFDTDGRRIVVCGDMAELGDEAVLFHRRLGNQVVTLANADLLIACGEFARDVVAGARGAGMPATRSIPCRTPDEALPYLGQAITPGDVVLVKGSRVVAMERVVEALQTYPKRRTA